MNLPPTLKSAPSRLAARMNLALLWLAGIPLPVILIIWLFRH